MQARISVGDGFRVSVSSTTPSTSSGASDPDDIDSLGDVYIWGEVLVDGMSPTGGTRTQVSSKTDILIPKIIESNVVLDVRQIACGARHIAIVTRQGEVFTWGEESGSGRLGHGLIERDYTTHPCLVDSLLMTNSDFVACGEFHTCVVSKPDDIFTWGDGTYNVGLLGHGTEASHWIPKRISNGALEGLEVVSIACGTWHSALATSNGKLFTFGDGAFGVLGHGDQESVWYPKEVQLLSGLKTIKVACGVWHTAAIVEVTFQSTGSNNISSWKLFTWGDGDKYRLGHGNKDTYLKPSRVIPLIEYNFHQIACGHTMTVALTTSGHVFTMGGTENGQLGNPASAGKIPTLVQDKLLGAFAEEISCGAHHVAVLTSKSELYTWGKGANGRLGHGDMEDKNSPTLVAALKDKHIKTISCGSNYTSCICIHKWVSGADQSLCYGCRQAFGLTRKRHNCHNCGLVFCHNCSSRKALNAALSPTPEKPHRVCDNCYSKLTKPSIDKKTTTTTPPVSQFSVNVKEKSARTLLSPITEPVKYLEIKNTNPETKHFSTSFVRASQVPTRVQLKDVVFPSSLSSVPSVSKPFMSPSLSQTPPPPQTPTCKTQTGPPRSSSPRFSGTLIDGLRKKIEHLTKEVSKLQNQNQTLKQKSDMQDMEMLKLQKKATEASAMAAVESSNQRVAIDFIKSIMDQLKEVAEKLPLEIPESKMLRTINARVEDFLKENSEYEEEESSLPSNSESKLQNAPDTPASDANSSKLHEFRLKENANATAVESCTDGRNFLEENNESKLDSDSEQQNATNIPPSDTDTSELQEQRLKENANAAEVGNSCEDRGNFVEETSIASKLESKQQNDSELQEHIVEENVNVEKVNPCHQDGAILLESSSSGSKLESKQENAPDIDACHSNNYNLQEERLEENDANAATVNQSQSHGPVLLESAGSSVSSIGPELSPQSSEISSRSESSTLERQGETQVIEKFDAGVYVTLMLRPDGIKIFRRVKFSKRRFTETQAEEWWNENKVRVLRKYCPTHQKQTDGSPCNITSHNHQHIEASPS